MKLFACACAIILFSSSSLNTHRDFLPPGTVKISGNFYADRNEVSILSWAEYMYWTKRFYGVNSVEYRATFPDTSLWMDTNIPSKNTWSSSYRDMKMKNYPISCITYEQALAFCKWRTYRVKYFLSIAKKHEDLEFEYRLPTRAEWEFLCDGASEVNFSKNAPIPIKDKLGQVKNPRAAQLQFDDSSFVSQPMVCGSYAANPLGIFDMIGNVSEMLSEKGISKGGSWLSSAEEARPGKISLYEGPLPTLGFRCVCVLKKQSN